MAKIVVMGGTPGDTQMGVDIINAKGHEAIFCPVASDPIAQTHFQYSSDKEKHDKVVELLKPYKEQGIDKVYVYCNSLSGAVNFRPIAKELDMKIITPLDVYEEIAKHHKTLGIIAAHGQSAGCIEKTMFNVREDVKLISTGMLPMVVAIENKEDPEEIIKRFHLVELCEYYKNVGVKALVLGCTHFPYFKEQLAAKTDLILFDPADEMLNMLMR